eukprot:2334818-Prymnesium_polylepis.1
MYPPDAQMLQQLHTQFAKTRGYRKPMRGADDTFAINHYAGQVSTRAITVITRNQPLRGVIARLLD